MGLITDVGSALQDEIDYIYLAGATGLHNRFGNLYNLVNGNIEVVNLKASAVTGSGTKVVLETSPTINTPTISSPTISGTVVGSPTFSGNLNFNGTNLFSTATANANRFHGLGDSYGGASTILSVTTDALASNNFYYLKCIADYNGTPYTAFGIGAGGSTFIASGADLYLDGGNDTSWRESSANVMTAKTNGIDRLSISTTQLVLGTTLDVIIQPTKKLYLDGNGDTYIDEVSANVLRFVSGNTEFMRSNASGEVLLPNVDPPTANYANRNGIVKGWIRATTGPGAGVISVIDSYNVSSATETGTGATLKINWNTDFASANYVFSGVVFANDGGGTPWPQGIMTVLTQTAGILEIQGAIHDGTSDGDSAINAAEWYIMAIGDQ